MTRPTEERTEGGDDRLGERFDFARRPLLKALGGGTALSLGSGVAAASGDASGDQASGDRDRDDGDRSEGIDPVFGYPTTDPEGIPEALAPDHEVELLAAPPGPDRPPLLYFDPTGLRVDPGDVVQFTFLSPDHTVTAFHPRIGLDRRVPEAAEPFSSPVLGPETAWLYRFEHEGVYDLYCAPHLDLGMVMRLVVGDLADAELPEYAQTVEGLPSREQASQGLNEMSERNENCEWPFLMPADILGTDALDAMTVQDRGEVPFADVAAELGYELESAEPAPDERDEPAAPTVRVRDHAEHGEILVGPAEMTLYTFDRDERGTDEISKRNSSICSSRKTRGWQKCDSR